MSLTGDKSFRVKMREVENAFKYRRIPYPKRTIELVTLIAISCTLFLFFHTNRLNSRLKEMEDKLQPSEFTALGLTGGNHISNRNDLRHNDINSLQGTYQYLKNTGQQRRPRDAQAGLVHGNSENAQDDTANANAHHHHDRNRKRPRMQPVELKAKKESHEKNDKIHKNHKNDKNADSKDKGANDDDKDDDYYTYTTADDDDDDDDTNIEAEILNNTKNAKADFVFFNRVPKVGSQSLMELMKRLGEINGFVHARDVGKAHETILLKPPEQRKLISELLGRNKPHIYSQHIAYINFTRFHLPKPIYINLVRDPIERVISWHYYVRAEWYYKDMLLKLGDKAPKMPPKEFLELDLDTCVRNKDVHCIFTQDEIRNPAGDHRRQTLFFCGQNRKLCMPFNSVAAMQKAKRTVEEDYAVVGTWEDTNITLTVLENYIPRYFRNAKVAYYLGKDRLSKVNKNNVKRPVSQETREILRKNLTQEIEFYEFCKQRLYLQYAALNGGNKIDNDDYLLIPEHNEEDDDEDY